MRPLFGMRAHLRDAIRSWCQTRCMRSTAVLPPSKHVLEHGPINLIIDRGDQPSMRSKSIAAFAVAVGTPLALGVMAVGLVWWNSSKSGPEINLKLVSEAVFLPYFQNTVKHQASYMTLKKLIEHDKFMDCVIVCGPQNAGKSWTTKHVLSDILNECDKAEKQKIKVIWVKAQDVHSMGHLISAFEDGIGATWPELSPTEVLLASILHHSGFSQGKKPPTDCKQRLLSVLHAFKKKVIEDKQSKYIVLLDDFEDQSGRPLDGDVSDAMRLILHELTNMASNGHVQPIVVSSDDHVDTYFSNSRRMHIRYVMVEWLREEEALQYVKLECPSVNEDEAKKIVEVTGKLAYHLRIVCTEINSNGKYSGEIVQDAVERICLSLAEYTDRCLKDYDREKVGWIQKVYEKYKSKGDISISIREYRNLSREYRIALDSLIQIGLLFKDHNTGAVKPSSIHSLTALADVFSHSETAHKRFSPRWFSSFI